MFLVLEEQAIGRVDASSMLENSSGLRLPEARLCDGRRKKTTIVYLSHSWSCTASCLSPRLPVTYDGEVSSSHFQPIYLLLYQSSAQSISLVESASSDL